MPEVNSLKRKVNLSSETIYFGDELFSKISISEIQSVACPGNGFSVLAIFLNFGFLLWGKNILDYFFHCERRVVSKISDVHGSSDIVPAPEKKSSEMEKYPISNYFTSIVRKLSKTLPSKILKNHFDL